MGGWDRIHKSIKKPPELVEDVMIGCAVKDADPSQKKAPWKDLARYLTNTPNDEEMDTSKASKKRKRAVKMNLIDVVFSPPTSVDLTGED